MSEGEDNDAPEANHSPSKSGVLKTGMELKNVATSNSGVPPSANAARGRLPSDFANRSCTACANAPAGTSRNYA